MLKHKASIHTQYCTVDKVGLVGDTMRRGLKKARQELYQTPGTPQRLFKEHCRIFNAIKQGKDKEARRAMFEHLDLVEKSMFK